MRAFKICTIDDCACKMAICLEAKMRCYLTMGKAMPIFNQTHLTIYHISYYSRPIEGWPASFGFCIETPDGFPQRVNTKTFPSYDCLFSEMLETRRLPVVGNKN